MPVVTKYAAGTPLYVDIGTPDLDAAAAFYGGLFGWDVVDLGDEAGGYRIASIDGNTVAGLGPQMNPGPPYWAQYVTVDDVDASLEAAPTAAGGAVLAPAMDVLDAGSMAVFADTTGAACAVSWTPNQERRRRTGQRPRRVLLEAQLIIDDLDKGEVFYGAVFGWTVEKVPMKRWPADYAVWKHGGRVIGGLFDKAASSPVPVPNHWSVLYFGVDDTDAAMGRRDRRARRLRDGSADGHRPRPVRRAGRPTGRGVQHHRLQRPRRRPERRLRASSRQRLTRSLTEPQALAR